MTPFSGAHQTYASLTGAIDFTQAYDADGMRTLLAADIASTHDFSNNYVYDNLHRLTKLTQAGVTGGDALAEKRVDIGYNGAGQFTSINRYSDVAGSSLVAASSYSYDLAGRLTGLTHADSSSAAIAGYGWTFDAANRITGVNFTDPAHASESAAYSYDDTNQLTSSVRSSGTDSDTYDANGNRINTGFTTSADNRLTSDGTFTYTYDSEGNRTSRTRISSATASDYESNYVWDYRNRLTAVINKNNSGSVTQEVDYTYDVYDRLIGRAVYLGGSTTASESQQFAYDGMQIVLAMDTAGVPTARNLWGPAVDQILATENVTSTTTPGTRSWALTDQQNTVRDQVDDSGSVINHIAYNSFGQITGETNSPSATWTLGYTGKFLDRLTGLQNNLERWYDVTGTWLNHDPLEADTNTYRYTSNQPINFIDPSGLARIEIKDHLKIRLLPNGIEFDGKFIRFLHSIRDRMERAGQRIQGAVQTAGGTIQSTLSPLRPGARNTPTNTPRQGSAPGELIPLPKVAPSDSAPDEVTPLPPIDSSGPSTKSSDKPIFKLRPIEATVTDLSDDFLEAIKGGQMTPEEIERRFKNDYKIIKGAATKAARQAVVDQKDSLESQVNTYINTFVPGLPGEFASGAASQTIDRNTTNILNRYLPNRSDPAQAGEPASPAGLRLKVPLIGEYGVYEWTGAAGAEISGNKCKFLLEGVISF